MTFTQAEKEWDIIFESEADYGDTLERIKVPGGWLYRSYTLVKKTGARAVISESMCFVPEPKE
jgi:predicted enzyme related to lactoylglutathione lyase